MVLVQKAHIVVWPHQNDMNLETGEAINKKKKKTHTHTQISRALELYTYDVWLFAHVHLIQLLAV
jgi:hypothetical protein